MIKKHHVIIIPGLGDDTKILKWATKSWRKYGLTPYIHLALWKKEEDFQTKLYRLINKIDELSKLGNVSIMGVSAGGSLALNTYCKKKTAVNKVINICGRLREGNMVKPSLKHAARKSSAFYQSVRLAEQNQKKLTKKDLQKFLTIRAIYDEIVPNSTIPLPGALNITLPTIEHIISITAAVTIFNKHIIKFLTQSNY